MKKGFSIVAAFLLLGSTTATAASQSSPVYKGYPTVNVTVNSQELQSEIPAINMDGTTLVPIRFVSEALGAKVDWLNESSTVNIKPNLLAVAANPFSDETRDLYQSIKDEVNRLQFLIQQLQIAKDVYLLEKKTSDIDLIRNADLAKIDDNYKKIYNQVLDLQNKYPKETIKITELTDDLLKYNQAVKSYKDAVEQLFRYIERSERKEYLSAYYTYISQANRQLREALDTINERLKNK